MVRTQIQLDEATYRAARRLAFERHVSLSAVVREALAASLGSVPKPARHQDFAFVASGRSRQGRRAPVSERHDEALVEALQSPKKR